MSARTIDTNGWIEIKGNPISKAGVFQYHGSQLPLSLGLDQNKMYNVYRPKEELESKEAQDSFKLLPWTDDHPDRLLGSADEGLVPAEAKGVHGVTGEEIFVDGDFLKCNLKVFSQELADQINSGKKDLSIGYKADYILDKGVYNGVAYDLVQTNLRGNHISLVDEGRSGREVSVLDNKGGGVVDMKEEKDIMAHDEDQAQDGLTLDMLASEMKAIKEALAKLMGVAEGSADGDMCDMGEKAEAKDEDEEEVEVEKLSDSDENEKEYIASEIKEDLDEDAVLDEDEDKDADKKGAMDSAKFKKAIMQEISQRNELAQRLSKHIGVFDSSSMTLSEVAKYGVKKLGLSCKKGMHSAVLDGYLAGRRAAGVVSKPSIAMDKAVKSKSIDQYLRGGK